MHSKLNSTQKIVVNLLQQLVPATQPCTVAFNNCLQNVPTRYRLHSLCTAYLTPNWLQSHPTQSIQLLVDSGAGRQQLSTNVASADWLQSLQITRPVYWLHSLIFTKTGYRVITSTTGYRAYQKVPAIQPCFTKTGYRVYPPSPFNSVLILGQVDVEAFTRITPTDWLRSVPTRCRSTQSSF